MKKELTPEEVFRRLNTPGEHYGQYVKIDPEKETLPCNCRVPTMTVQWIRKDDKIYCKFCGREL